MISCISCIAQPIPFIASNPEKQAKILKCVGSNFVFDGVNVTATYRKPFDILAERPSNDNWLPG